MKISQQLFFVLGILVIISSCNPTYLPNTINSPIFSNKGEFQTRMIGGASGFNPQFSYALTHHWGVMLNGSFFNPADEFNVHHPTTLVELGTGLYSNTNGWFVYEIFTGFGGGQSYGNIEIDPGNTILSNSNYSRFFIQPALGVVTEFFDMSLATRFVALDVIPEVATTLRTSQGFFEPALSLAVGFRYVKLHAQMGFSLPMGDQNNLAFQYQPFMFNTGIVGRIGRKYF